MNEFGKELAQLRKRANITQYQLAKDLNLSRSYVFRFESGERNPNIEIVKKIFQILKLSKYEQIKLLVLGNMDFELENNKATFKICFHLALDLKDKGLTDKAKYIVEKAMLNFDNMIELHALLANLNLLNNDYEGAIKANQETLEYLNNIPLNKRSSIGISKAEIIHNLGYVYFERGLNNYYHRDQLIVQSWKNDDKQYFDIIKELETEITLDFEIASEKIKEALLLEPKNLHITDQLARLYYYMGDLSYNIIQKNEMFDKSISLYDVILDSDNNDIESFKKQESSIFIALAFAKKFNITESSRLINTVINYKPLYYLGYLAKACIYSINAKNNKSFLDISYKSLLEAIKLNLDLKNEIKSEVDLYNLRFSEEYKNKFNDLFNIEGQENE